MAVAEGRGIGAVVAFHRPGLFGEIEVMDEGAVEAGAEAGAAEGEFVVVPLGGFVDLLARGDGAVQAAGQFAGLGLGVVAKVGHLEFEAVEGGVAGHGSADGEAAVAAFAEQELELQFEVAVLPFAYQPAAAVAGACEHAIADLPGCACGTGLGDIVPGADGPAGGRSVVGEQGLPRISGDEAGAGGEPGRESQGKGQEGGAHGGEVSWRSCRGTRRSTGGGRG